MLHVRSSRETNYLILIFLYVYILTIFVISTYSTAGHGDPLRSWFGLNPSLQPNALIINFLLKL